MKLNVSDLVLAKIEAGSDVKRQSLELMG